jgi:hypothetical protein
VSGSWLDSSAAPATVHQQSMLLSKPLEIYDFWEGERDDKAYLYRPISPETGLLPGHVDPTAIAVGDLASLHAGARARLSVLHCFAAYAGELGELF